jgi:uncharacterized protein YeaO (DUF488 family)
MLKESYVAKLKTLSKNAIKIAVGYPSVFSPSETLLKELNETKSALMKKGMTEPDARNRAWQQIDFEKRYRKEIESKPDVIDKLKKIKELAKKKDVFLYCYCGKYPCHRFILIDMIRHLEK